MIITRLDDTALSDSKRGDLKERKDITNTSNADLLISIHQNSFPKADVMGAQVFYHNSSEGGEKLATYIQDEIKKNVDPSNNRLPKANTDYYMLKNTKVPAVIVECGFISNQQEESKLNQEDYQKKIAWAIYLGIINYFTQV